MRKIVLSGTIALLLIMALDAQEKPALPALTLKDLQERPVIGELGIPLGTVADVEAIVVSGRELRSKYDSSAYLLKITHVNRQRLIEPHVIRFTVPAWIDADLANDSFALHKMKYGEEASRLDDERIKKMEEGYVGKRFHLAVYEVGEFRGIPEKMPEDLGVWQDVGFGFRTSLIVLADRDSREE